MTKNERCWDLTKIMCFHAERFALCLDGCQRGVMVHPMNKQ
jgi:hypothetical protein